VYRIMSSASGGSTVIALVGRMGEDSVLDLCAELRAANLRPDGTDLVVDLREVPAVEVSVLAPLKAEAEQVRLLGLHGDVTILVAAPGVHEALVDAGLDACADVKTNDGRRLRQRGDRPPALADG
jgi:anti-anti-sigma regulatory factor